MELCSDTLKINILQENDNKIIGTENSNQDITINTSQQIQVEQKSETNEKETKKVLKHQSSLKGLVNEVSSGRSGRWSKQSSGLFQSNSRSSLESEGKQYDALFEKKRNRFRVVKDWEDRRIQKASIFQSIFSEVGENISKIATQSNEFIENLISFMKDTQIQFAQFAKSHPIQVEEAFKYSPHISNVSYPSINRVLRNVSCNDKNQQSNAEKLAKFIDENIIRIFLLIDKKNFTNIFSSFTTLLKDKKTKIAKLDKVAVSAYVQYSELFKELMQLQAKNKETKKDLYYYELIYMHHVSEHLENLREFGLQVVRFTEELEQLQRQRLKNVHQALSLYLKKKRELMEGLEDYDVVQEMVDSMEQELENTKLEMTTLLQPEQENYIKQCYKKNMVDMPILKQFAQDFNLRNSADKILVIKELSAQHQQIDKTSKKKEWIDCSLVLTIDGYLIVSAGMLDSFGKPLYLIFLPNSKARFSKDTMTLTLTETHNNLFWNSNKIFDFKLQHEFDANEITSFLSQNKMSAE